MRSLIFSVVLICVAWNAEAADVIEKGAEDLLRNSTLSQPFTIFDQLLVNLDRKASQVAIQFRPERNDFRPSRNVLSTTFSTTRYDNSTARTMVEFSTTVSGIDDPWRNVCKNRVSDIATSRLQLPYYKEWQQEFKLTILGFFSEILGSRLASADAQLENYKAFSDSIVVALSFSVESGNREKPLKFLRQCFWDNKTAQVSFREYIY